MSGPKRFAYVVMAVERRAPADLDLTHAPGAPQIGDVQVFEQPQGGQTVIQEQAYGAGIPLVDIVHLHFVGAGEQLPDGDVAFEYETRRLLALIQIGAKNERAVHDLVDQLFERFEQFGDETRDLEPEARHEALERLRKEYP